MDEILNCQIQSKRQDIRKTVHPCLGDVSHMQQLDNYFLDIALKISAQSAQKKKKEKKREVE